MANAWKFCGVRDADASTCHAAEALDTPKMKAASEKIFPVLTVMHHAGKNAQGYPDGAKHKPTLLAPCVALCHLLSLPLIAA